MNQYQCVANPINHKSKRSKRKFRKIIVAIWLIASCFSVIQLFIYRCKPISTDEVSNKYCYCYETWGTDRENTAKYYAAYTVWIFFQTYLFPAIVIIVMYSKVILTLRERQASLTNQLSIDQSLTSSLNNGLGIHTIKVG